jgi:1-acyl-sn-glycerol-3-phosphate acyltransferase
MAIRAGVPIVPIATIGGGDAMPVLIRGDRPSQMLRLDKLLRLKVFPVALSLPWGVTPAALPQFESSIQRGMDALARRRALPLFG